MPKLKVISAKQFYGARRRNEGIKLVNQAMLVLNSHVAHPLRPMFDATYQTKLRDVVKFLSCVLSMKSKPIPTDCSEFVGFPPPPE